MSANSADQDQAAPLGAVWSGSTLFAILSRSLIIFNPIPVSETLVSEIE